MPKISYAEHFFCWDAPNGKVQFSGISPPWKIGQHFIDYSEDRCHTAAIFVRDLLRYKYRMGFE